MAERAHVESSEAIEAFRASLLVYASKARPIVNDAADEVSRTRQWLQAEQRAHLENQVRLRRRKLEQAQQELFSAEAANLREPAAAQRAAVQRAKHLVEEAEDKLKRLKQWSREFDNRVAPLVKQLEQLRTLLDSRVPKASAHLAEVVKILDAYAGVASPSVAPAASPASAPADAAGADSAPKPDGAEEPAP